LKALSSPPFYTAYVHLPNADAPVPAEIRQNTKWFPYFQMVLGAIDGTHIPCTPSANDRALARNRKGEITQNCLAACGFDMLFYYIQSGWDGSVNNARMYMDARTSDLRIPPGRRYLADAGFAMCDTLFIPYRGVRYHLAEWGRVNQRQV
jgi:hypothetical protein